MRAPGVDVRVVRHGAGALARLAGMLLLAAVLAAPVAAAWAVTQTRVEATVGITPVTLQVQVARQSELRLGVPGTIYLPVSAGPLGLVATVEGPGDPEAGDADLASYVSPQMLELYTGLFHDPGPAVALYVDLVRAALLHEFLVADLALALVGGIAWQALRLLRPDTRSRGGFALRAPNRGEAAAVAILLLATCAVAGLQLGSHGAGEEHTGRYALPVLDGTLAEGGSTDSPLLRLVLGGAVPKVQTLIRRQEEGEEQYRTTASAGLRAQEAAMSGPRTGETAVLMQSDMHCNTTLIRLQTEVATLLASRYGEDVPALMAITGDLTTNGTPAEGGCIKDEVAIMSGRPVAAVTGNHESEVSTAQMKNAGMKVLEGTTETVGDVRVLGDADPARSELFGSTRLRGDESEADVGQRLYDRALADRPDLVLVHEAYAAEAFIGTTGMTDFLEARGSATAPYDDGVRDLPAGAVFYGHWHRSIEPRVVWNDDGTWTLVMELDTSGGAIDTPTIGHFSTPWSRPQQEASFPVVFLDQETGLVTGYQTYLFDTDGTVTVEPRVDVGVPQPDTEGATTQSGDLAR